MPKESNVKAFPEQEASEQTEFNFIEFDFDKLFDGDLKKKIYYGLNQIINNIKDKETTLDKRSLNVSIELIPKDRSELTMKGSVKVNAARFETVKRSAKIEDGKLFIETSK